MIVLFCLKLISPTDFAIQNTEKHFKKSEIPFTKKIDILKVSDNWNNLDLWTDQL